MDKTKSYDISKQVVWEAYKKVEKGVEKYAPKSVFSNFGLKNQLFFV